VTVPPKVPPPNPESLQRDWRISIKCPEWKQVARLASLNAGPGGIFLNTPREPTMGSGVELHVELPNGSKLKLIGHVQRVLSSERAKRENRSPGVAIKLDPEHEAQLRKHAEEAKPGANAPSQGRKSRPEGTVAGAIGIDFGTTYTSASAAIGSAPITPSSNAASTCFHKGFIRASSTVYSWCFSPAPEGSAVLETHRAGKTSCDSQYAIRHLQWQGGEPFRGGPAHDPTVFPGVVFRVMTRTP